MGWWGVRTMGRVGVVRRLCLFRLDRSGGGDLASFVQTSLVLDRTTGKCTVWFPLGVAFYTLHRRSVPGGRARDKSRCESIGGCRKS